VTYGRDNDGRTDGQRDRRADREKDGRKDGRTDGWTDGWIMDGWVEVRSVNLTTLCQGTVSSAPDVHVHKLRNLSNDLRVS
jgi:hypothetical protein